MQLSGCTQLGGRQPIHEVPHGHLLVQAVRLGHPVSTDRDFTVVWLRSYDSSLGLEVLTYARPDAKANPPPSSAVDAMFESGGERRITAAFGAAVRTADLTC
ncbi:hypothetical protein R1flu_026642 [Riccia fluitans]|uniref:Uncharacterized protein n=1 Tax=Riccia fluitans TaxID=41844 RepID=A0ABD1XH46_9MARC